VVVVVSEDGGVNLVPVPRPRVRRQVVDDAVIRLEAALDSGDPREFSESFDAIKALSFYLSEEQCERVNTISRAEQQRREEAGVIVIIREELQPRPTCTTATSRTSGQSARLVGLVTQRSGDQRFPPPLDNSDFGVLVRMPTPLTCWFVFVSRGYPQVYRVNFSVGYQNCVMHATQGWRTANPATRCGFR